MMYRLYSSHGNTLGVDEYIALFEIGDDGYYRRYIEFHPRGQVLMYSRKHPADELGILPEGLFDDKEARKKAYGTLLDIPASQFEVFWKATHAANMTD